MANSFFTCGCEFVDGFWTQCPMHKTAPELLAALEGMIYASDGSGPEVYRAVEAVKLARGES